MIFIVALLFTVSLWCLVLVVAWLVSEKNKKLQVLSRQNAAVRELPESLDNLSVLLLSGASLNKSLHTVATSGREGALKTMLSQVVQRLRTGSSVSDAFQSVFGVTDSKDLKAFARLVIQSDNYGMKLANTLERLASQLRYEKEMRSEKLAQQLPVKLLFPLALFIFPATVIPFIALIYVRLTS